MQPAHHVGAVTRLGVQRRAYRQHPSAFEVEQLGDQRGRAQIHRHPQPWARLKGEGRVIDQYGSVPLPQLNFQIAFDGTLAGETPPLRDLPGRKPLPLRPVNFRVPFENPNAAAPAPALPATGELDSLLEQQVAQQRFRPARSARPAWAKE